jgi:hypothetical protein
MRLKTHAATRRRNSPAPWRLAFLVSAAFLFRLGFGLCQSHWPDLSEQFQNYLVGLKFYTTGLWPYFGADMFASESSYRSQVPGALQGLFIGLPFYLWRAPEAPFVLVNLFSILGVALLAWYIHKRLPGLSHPWLFLWIAVVPWSVNYSTNVYNMCFILLPSVLFFIGFLESIPLFSLGLLSSRLANALMGLGLFWIAQFHFSYILLIPFIALSLFLQIKKSRKLLPTLDFALGALIPLAFLVPTYLQYELGGGKTSAGMGFMVPFNWANVANFFTILARFFSLACSELPRFIGAHTHDRLEFLTAHPHLLVPGAVLWIVGYIQPFVLLYFWFKKDSPGPHWRPLRFLILAALVLVWGSFWFTIKRPLSHQYLILFPLIMIYSCYCWARFKDKKGWPLAAKLFIVLSLLFQAGYAVAVAPKDSIWNQREVILRALQEKNYHLVGERPPGTFY